MLLGAGCAYYNTFYNAKSFYREGLKLKEQNQHSQAKAKFDKAIEKSALVIKQWPKSRWVDDALFLVGASYYEEGQYSKAIRHFDQLGLAFPNSSLVPEADLYRGLSLLADKQYGTARVTLDAVRLKHPRFADVAAYNLAKSFIDRDDPERGVDSLASFIERFPKSRFRRSATKLLADAAFKQRRFARAEQAYDVYARLSEDPKERALAKLKIAACRYEQGKYQETAGQVSDVLGRYAALDDEANLLLGKALAETGRENDALGTWVKVRSANDLGAEAAFRIGKHYEEAAEYDKARAYYDTARIRRVDSDYGVLAVKRLALLDALSARTTGKKTGGDSLTPVEAAFLVAEVNNLNLGDYDKAMELYQKVYDSFPDTDWAAKALFAKAWLVRNAKSDTTGAEPMLRQVIAEYPETEYADESRRWLGLPVPKREKKPEVKPETTASVPPPVAGDSARTPGLEPTPVPSESLSSDTGKVAVEPEPEEFLPSRHRPGRLPERPDRPKGPPGRGERPGPEDRVRPSRAGDRLPGDTVSVPQPESAKPDTAEPTRTPKVAEPEKPATKLEMEIPHFATDSWQILAQDSASLRADAESLKVHPDVEVAIVGHCDPRASEEYNRELGLKRAQAVRDFLVAAGVESGRITVRSEGEGRPISTKPDEYWLDRRVEFELR
jgi:TolA-binding protein/outer membrane protein OmpA-like peptidoglycan-associated protein